MNKFATGYRRILRTSAHELPKGCTLPVSVAYLIITFCEMNFFGGLPSFKKRPYLETDTSIFKDEGHGVFLREDDLGYELFERPSPEALREEVYSLGEELLEDGRISEGFVISPDVPIASIPPEIPTRDLALYLSLFMYVIRHAERLVASSTPSGYATVYLDQIEEGLLRFLDKRLEEDGNTLSDIRGGILADMGKGQGAATG